MSDDLEPLTPWEAVKMYLDHREPELSEKSVMNHKYRLDVFLEFCEERGIENLNELTGRDLHRFRTWRSEQDITTMTLRTNLATLRVFLEFCASIDGVEQGLREKVVLPEVSREEQSKDVKLDVDRAEAILEHMERFEYASRAHVVMAIFWHTGVRLGTLRALDLDDVDLETPCLRVRHRSETSTPLKNGKAADRSIALGEQYAKVIEDYITHNRIKIEDSHGREPLISSNQGRLTESSVRLIAYKWTRPCMIGDCPHDKDPVSCEYMSSKHASGCPSSRSPHGIRRGALTRMLRQGTPEEVVSGRSNVTSDVLELHYDQRSERERMELRREFLEDV
ncbi:tyrosine-type recombinase/integrase [Halobellus captivus]|uniref:tyrosine-type recombinase/integrase n=1 Tax=Halobellus captivus TaxID=2592614 RepID=UPI0011A7E49D|nr:tyrosine-type recombinase/integrase [Halobellus captivus]